MQISDEQFTLILEEINIIRARGPGLDKRRAPRHECNTSAVITLVESGAPSFLRRESSSVTVKNISYCGISILNPRPLPAGSRFIIPLSAPVGRAVAVLCTVTHSRAMTQHLFVVGAEFTEVVNEPAKVVTMAG